MAVVKLTKDQLDELKKCFMLYDYDQDGKIFASDIPGVIRSVGLKPSQKEVQDIQGIVNEQAGGMVDLQNLVSLVSQLVTTPTHDRPDDMMDMFRMYDTDGRGVVSEEDMRHMLTTVGEKLTDDEVDTLFRMSGCKDARGGINYQKFVQAVLQR